VRAVSASVEGRTVDLTFQNGYWRGEILLTGTTRGAKQLLVTARDAAGNTASVITPFSYDRPPRLVLSSPEHNTVARTGVRLVARCEDDDPTGCRITVTLFSQPGGAPVSIAQGVGAMDTTVSLAAHDGSTRYLTFEARDSGGQRQQASRVVYIESSSRWTELASAGARVWDIDANRILYADSSAEGITVRIRDRGNGTITTIGTFEARPAVHIEGLNQTETAHRTGGGYLSPRGAIFLAERAPLTHASANVFEWRDGALIGLGPSWEYPWLTVAGSWAIWNSARVLYRRDLNAGTTVLIATDASYYNDVATNGDVVYVKSGGGVMRYRAGVSTALISEGAVPRTDGLNVVYAKQSFSTAVSYQIAMHDGVSELMLTPVQEFTHYPKPDYQANNGWVAYTKLGSGGVLQVWTRARDGTQRQVSSFGAQSVIEALGPNGEVAFYSGNRRYRSAPPYTAAPVDIGSAALPYTRIFWVDGQLVVILGRSAFRVD
jgi:hypothetical protein